MHVGTLENGVNASLQESHLGHFRKHTLHERRIAIDAAWLQEMLHLEGQLVDGRIFGGELVQGDPELKRGLKIRRTLPA